MENSFINDMIARGTIRDDAMDAFMGRKRELDLLQRQLARVRAGGRAGRPGRAILMRGRRRVGKSRLAEEFIDQARVPYLYFTASAQRSVGLDLRLFTQAAAASSLPGAGVFEGQSPADWPAALSLLTASLADDQPCVVVIDEMPYLIGNDPGFEGSLQAAFDRELSRKPVLLLCIGSDLAMMEALNAHGRPFHQRATEMVVPPLSPADVADMVGLPAAQALDAYLICGGLPLILDEWPHGMPVLDYLAQTVADPTSALLVSGERSLAAEFPAETSARDVLSAIGSGARTHALVGRAAGDIPSATLSRALHLLTEKRVVVAQTPLSTVPSRETRYSIADPHLRFWLAFLGPYLPEIERGRSDLVLSRIERSWTTWRGEAIEPVVRESLRRLPTHALPENTRVIGSYWTRTNDPQIDIVGADREPIARQITAVGSVKWLENRPFDRHDLHELIVHRSRMPGTEEHTALMAVARAGVDTPEVTAFTPEDLVQAWRYPDSEDSNGSVTS
jgi:AAA+ ATPase superfamily predicted ATPase